MSSPVLFTIFGVFLFTDYSYHTLSGLVTNNMGLNVRNGDVFIFVNKARNRIKLLHMEPGGLVIYSKMLEEGRFRLPSRDQEQ